MGNTIFNQVFSRATGNADNYRIPAIVKTKSGVIVACADERYYTGADNPNRIDKVIRRSTDGGVTWQEQIVAVKEYGESKMNASAAIDPCLLYDEDSNTVFMIYLHSPSKVWILDSAKGTGYDSAGRKLLKIGKSIAYVADSNDIIYADGKRSGYVYDGDAYVYKDGENAGDIYSGTGPVREYPTCFLYICKSTDEGLTWSKPECLNLQVKDKYMTFIGACPGAGLKIKNGKHAGRLVLPIYFNTLSKMLSLSSCVIYSDDGGVTWKRGKSPNDGRRSFIFKLSSRFVGEPDMITESQVIEMPDGVLRMFMRNHSPKRLISMAESRDGGETWTELSGDTIVSMNLWGFTHSYMDEALKRFPAFLDEALKTDPVKGEYFLPSVVSQLIAEGKARVKVLRSHERWYGVTYKEDKEAVVAAIAEKTAAGVYPDDLWR